MGMSPLTQFFSRFAYAHFETEKRSGRTLGSKTQVPPDALPHWIPVAVVGNLSLAEICYLASLYVVLFVLVRHKIMCLS